MTHGGKMVACLTGGLLLCQGAGAVSDNPYSGIVARNVFALKPPPAPVAAEEAKPALSKITLSGITTILGKKQALMKTAAPPGKPGEAPKGEQSYILAEGEREGELEVLEIDEKAGTVKLKNGGVFTVLNFDKDGQKLVSSPIPPAAPPPISAPGAGGLRPPSVNPYAQPRPANPAGFNLPSRPLRAQPAGVNPVGASYSPGGYAPGGYAPGGFGTPATPTVSAGGASLPLYGGTAAAAQAQAVNQQPAVTPEQQIITLEALREVNKNNPNFPPLPPTPLNPNPAGTAGSAGQTPTTPTVSTPPRLPGMPQQLPPMPQ